MKQVRSLAFASLFVVFAMRSGATTINEDFSSNPLQNGWHIFGGTNLFQWDSTNKNLRVTWDSSQRNSYFSHPLGTILPRDANFTITLYLPLDDIRPTSDAHNPSPCP